MEIGEGEATHIVDIPGLLFKMADRISKTQRRRRTTGDKRCIFQVREGLNYSDIPDQWIEPQVVALGPYHHGMPRLQNMEEIKWRWFASFMESRKGKLVECLIQLGRLENEVRECYSDSIFGRLSGFGSEELLEMMVVDGFFILALFFRATLKNFIELDRDGCFFVNNPLCRLDMVILSKIYGDLLLLQNQIPSFVLEKLGEICFHVRSKRQLFEIAKNFLCSISIPRFKPPNGCLRFTFDCMAETDWLHLLDLVRLVFISHAYDKAIISSAYYEEMRITFDDEPFGLIPSVTMLCRAGIKVKRHTADTFFDVNFKNGVIQIPDITLDDSMCSLLVNCVAFEQSCNISKHFSIYATLLDYLVNTAKDVNYLCNQGVIGNFIGTDADVAQFINNLGRGLTIYNDRDDYNHFFLLDIFGGISKYYKEGLKRDKWTSFKSEYFGKPWLLISAFVGLVLLVLSFLQTYYTIYAYEHPKI